MMFTTYLIPIVAALPLVVSTTKATLHPSWPLTKGSEVCKQDINALVEGLKTVPFFDDVTTLFVAGMIKSSCTAPVVLTESSQLTPAVPVPMTIDGPRPVVVEVATNSPSSQHSATSVPLTIGGSDPVDVDASFEVCPWIPTLPLTISGPSDRVALTSSASTADETTSIAAEKLAVVQAPAVTIPYKFTAQAEVTYPVLEDMFFGEETPSNATDSEYSGSTFMGGGSSDALLLEDLCIIESSQPVRFSDASIAGIVPRGRAPDSLKDRFPILYLLVWWYGIAILGFIVGSNFPSTPFFGKSWTQTYGNVSLASDKALEKAQSLGGRFGSTRGKDQALSAEYLYLIKVPAYSAFAINFAMTFFRHYHRRNWKPFATRGLLMYALRHPESIVNVPLRSPHQLDVLPRQNFETLILQQRAALIEKDHATTSNRCRALVVSAHLPTDKSIRFHAAAILPSTCANRSGSIHCASMTPQPLMQVIDPKRFGYMIECALRVGPHRDVATKLIMERLRIDRRIQEITAERDDACEKLDKQVARTRSLEVSLDEVHKTTFDTYQQDMDTLKQSYATGMETREKEWLAHQEEKLEQKDVAWMKVYNAGLHETQMAIQKSHDSEMAEEKARSEAKISELEKANRVHKKSDIDIRREALQDKIAGHMKARNGTKSQEKGDLKLRGDIVKAKIDRHLEERYGKKPEEKSPVSEDDKETTNDSSQDQAIVKLENDLEEANKKVADLTEANQTLENEKKQAEGDHRRAIDQLEKKLATSVGDKDHLAEANQLLRDRYERLEAKKTTQSSKFNSQLEEKESALVSMKAAKTESDEASKKTIDDLTKQLQECKSALKAKETELEKDNSNTNYKVTTLKTESHTAEQDTKPHEKNIVSWADECEAASSFWSDKTSFAKNIASPKTVLETDSMIATVLGDRATSNVGCTDTGDFARTTIDIFENSRSSGGIPTVKLFIKGSGTSPVQNSGANSTTATPSSSRSSGSFPSWNEYFAGRSSTTSNATDEWEDVSEASLNAAKRGKNEACADKSTIAKKGRGFRNSSIPKRLLRFDRS